jgi:20S proteasome alpha/beta subunit
LTLVIAQLSNSGSGVIASDSQATIPGIWKTLSAKKIHIIHKQNPAVVAGFEGDPAYASYTARQLRKLEEFTVDGIEKTVGDVYERFIDREVRKGNNTLGVSMALILQEEKNLRLYRVSEQGVAEQISKSPYLCIGSGMLWADWLMGEFGQFSLNSIEALELASYVIEMTSLVDPNVGGDIQAVRVLNVKKFARAVASSREDLDKAKEGAAEKRSLLRTFWYAIGQEQIRKLMKKQLAALPD